MAAEITVLKTSKDQQLSANAKNDFLYVFVLLYRTLYLYWWPLVAAPDTSCADPGIFIRGGGVQVNLTKKL